MKSLRARALTGGIIWAILAILIGIYGLASYLDSQTQQRFDELLRSRHMQVIVALANYYDNPESIARGIGDSAYSRPFSGEYWQIENAEGDIFVSRSLVDTLLPKPRQMNVGVIIATVAADTGESLRRAGQWVTLDDGSRWHVQVASSLVNLNEDRKDLRSNLLLAFGAIVIIGVAGAFLQVSATLRPLVFLRRDVLSRWDGNDELKIQNYPIEVAPLVNDINTLLERNREIIGRSRRQAADLAHAIKTPSAIIRNELEKLKRDNLPVDESLAALDRLDAQLKRSFARMRADGGHAGVRTKTELDEALGRLVRAFSALAGNQGKELSADVAPGLRIRMDQSDFEEVMGNLLDNAMKWSANKIFLSASVEDDIVTITIEDDGPGISVDNYSNAAQSGRRLDTSKPGTGLGLAIAGDLAHAYGGKVKLGESKRLGGLKVSVTLPVLGV